jgi:nucleolar protein 15
VSKIRISRNKKTGKSKGYGFLEFQNPGVAKVVADAMDGYMFFGQKLQSRVMNRNEVHPEIFKGANRVFKKVPWKKLEVERHNKEVDEKVAAKRTKTAEKRDKARKDRIKDAGIDYDFPSTSKSSVKPAAAKGKKKTVAAEKKAPAPAVEKKAAAAPAVKKAPAKAPASKKAAVAEKQPDSPPKRVTRSRAVLAEEPPAAKKAKVVAATKTKKSTK